MSIFLTGMVLCPERYALRTDHQGGKTKFLLQPRLELQAPPEVRIPISGLDLKNSEQ